MPVLSNPKHERFAQELAKGKSAGVAYEAAGYKRDDKNAHRLTKNDGVLTRVAEMLEKAAVKTEVTIEYLTAEYKQNMIDAKRACQHGVVRSVLDSLAKLHGLWVEKSERTNRYETMTDDELEQSLARKLLRIPGRDDNGRESGSPRRDN